MNQVRTSPQQVEQLLRIQGVSDVTTLSKSCINLWVAQGKFPRPLTLSSTIKVWRASDIQSWLEMKVGDTVDAHVC
jgi:predicted DNA-binding transcriptional regulator AlpA